MASLKVVDKEGKQVKEVEVPDGIVNQEIKEDVLHLEVRRYLASLRAGTHSTKGRSEVSGGGRKPWRQKGTGRARAGSIRSPLWKGGGVVFGPKPRDYSFKLNKKVIRKCKIMALSEKFKNNQILIVEEFGFEEPKTKKALEILDKFNLKDKKVLVVLKDLNSNEARSFRNISNVCVSSVHALTTYNMLVAEHLVFTENSFNEFVERLGNGRS
ncbi:MAG: 50S ribosomal protein L4 [Actinobacteria bacterium]|nr:50S ribosomal protein L4 [Actinomycetota bacterium]